MIIRESVFEKEYEGELSYVPLKDIPKEFLNDEHYINIKNHLAFYGSDSANDAFTIVEIIKYREQTLEEKASTEFLIKERMKESKKLRKEQYLKLKKEFES